MPRPRRIRRRDFLTVAAAAPLFGSYLSHTRWAIAVPSDVATSEPVRLGRGPHLMLDEDLFAEIDGLRCVAGAPERLPTPVLDSRTFGVTQPYLTVLRDPETQKFRLWYNHGPQIWHAESDDGITWRNPQVAWALPRGYGCSLLDDGPSSADPARRFKLANWQATRSKEDTPEDDAGMWVGFSPDGLHWSASSHNPVLKTWPEGPGKFVRHGVGDTVDVFYDSIRRRYGATPKVHALESDGWPAAPKAGKAFRRLVGVTYSSDFEHWSRPERILVPDEQDEGLLEFYGVGGTHARGRLLVGFARILRDDLPCDPGGPVDGIGYSVLVTSPDGLHWHRYRDPFLDRNPVPGSWDHAMTWMSAAVPVGDTLYLYYGGYARGHKIAAETERQIGLAQMKVDRYAGFEPTGEEGRLVTRPLKLAGDKLSINFRAPDGDVRVRLLDERAGPIRGFDLADSQPLTGDQIAAEVGWATPLSTVTDAPVRIEFNLRRCTLYAFNVVTSAIR